MVIYKNSKYLLKSLNMIILVLGGARSGKSRYAIKYAESLSNFSNFYYIATAQAMDEEMKKRIERHKKERGDKWKLIEEPLDLCEVLKKFEKNSVALIDCLALWVINLMTKNYSLEESFKSCLLYTSPSPRDRQKSRMPSSA